MKADITYRELQILSSELVRLGPEIKGPKLVCNVARNLHRMREPLEAVVKAAERSGEYAEYDRKRLELCGTFAVKDESGNPKTVPGALPNSLEYVIADKAAFEEAHEKLQREYGEAIENRRKQSEDVEALLNSKVPDLEFVALSDEHFDNAHLDARISGVLSYFIE